MASRLDRNSINPAICGSKPCIKGTRISVSLILGMLAKGMSETNVLAEYPALTHGDVLAAMAYGVETMDRR